MNRGERIWKSLLNPIQEDIAATEWILLYVLWKVKKASTQLIQNNMTKLWKKINAHDLSFYLIFPQSNDGHNCTSLSLDQELTRFCEIGIANQEWQNDTALWSLTENGIKVLNEWRPRIQKRIPSVHFKEGQV